MRISRRNVLRGAGAALALPWLESLEPLARAQASSLRKRFVAIYFPDGAVTSWPPVGIGAGNAWQPSPVLAPLASVKPYTTVLSHVGNYAPFGGHVEPSNGFTTGAFLTCTTALGFDGSPGSVSCGTSVDQIIAQNLGTTTPIESLQLSLATQDSYCDGAQCACSRTISWASPTQPLYPVVNPQTVFDRLVGAIGSVDAGAAPGRTANKSILDCVLGHATSVQRRLSRSDRARMDQFMTSVRALEANIQTHAATCSVGPRPPEAIEDMNVPPDYNRDVHANIMIDLMVMALQCDLTRVISHMMDDDRSDTALTFLDLRHFTATGSTLTGTPLVGSSYAYNEGAGPDNDGFATVNYWFVEKLARLCQKMLSVDEGPSGNLLDQSVVWFGSNFHGSNHDALDLPLIYVGSGGFRLKVDQHIDFATTTRGSEELHNVYLTLLQRVFDLPVTSFGSGPTRPWENVSGPPLTSTVVPEILA